MKSAITQDQIEHLSPNKIVVGERQRKTEPDLSDLLTSIKDLGILHPIITTDELLLISGHNRLKCALILKLETVPVVRKSKLSAAQIARIELEENICRNDLAWDERVLALAKYHELLSSENILQTQADTAASAGVARSSVTEALKLADALIAHPELREEANPSVARRKALVLEEEALLAEMDRRKLLKSSVNLIHGDCLAVMKTMADDSIDLIVTDPPYGLDITKHESGDAVYDGHLSMLDEYQKLIHQVLLECHRILKPNSHLYMFFPPTLYPEMHKLFASVFKAVCHVPIVWHKGFGSPPSVSYDYTSCYECIMMAHKGLRQLNGHPPNVLSIKMVPGPQRIHPCQKPHELIAQLIEASSSKGDLVLDPFCGSGQIAISAQLLGRRGIGIEQNEKYWQQAKLYAQNTLRKES